MYGAFGSPFPVTVAGMTTQVDLPVEEMAARALVSQWPNIQQKMRAEIDASMAEARTNMMIAGAVVLVGVFAAAVWVRSGRST